MSGAAELIVDLGGGEVRGKVPKRSSGQVSADSIGNLRGEKRGSTRFKTLSSTTIENFAAETSPDVNGASPVDATKMLLFGSDPTQGRAILSDDYAKLLAMCFNATLSEVSCPADQEKGWRPWAEKWFNRYCDGTNDQATEILTEGSTGLPDFEWFSEYFSTASEDSLDKIIARGSAPGEYKSAQVIHSGTSISALEVLDQNRSSDANCGFIVDQIVETMNSKTTDGRFRPLFVLLNYKSQYSLLSTLDGILWHHFDSSKDAAHEDYARLWVRRAHQLCSVWLDEERIRFFPRSFTVVMPQERAKSSLGRPDSFEWTHEEDHASLLFCVLQISLFLATKFSTWPFLPISEKHESTSQLLQNLRQQCRYFCTFLTWYQHLKLKNGEKLIPDEKPRKRASGAKTPRRTAGQKGKD